jgi:thioredoxin-dependent peroxiredoxin
MKTLSLSLLCTFALALPACAKSAPSASVSPSPNSTPESTPAVAQAASMQTAADFTATDGAGARSKLSDMKGSLVVVYFYPKDETPGCTKEACAFRDSFAEYTKRGIKIVGISQDGEESHKQFRTKYNLPFLLVADTDGAVTKAYGVGSTFGMSSRVTFLVDKQGKIAKSWPNVDPGVHAQEVLAAAGAL